MKILTIIPARSGSKGIPHKNVKVFNGKPLMAWSIEQAQKSKYKDDMRIIVSTDDTGYMLIANKFGAEVPFTRPENISGDDANDYQFIRHAVETLKNNHDYVPDIVLHLRPTQPMRKVADIDRCLSLFISNYDNYDSLRTVVPVDKSPFKMYTISETIGGHNLPLRLNPLFETVTVGGSVAIITEPYNEGRQKLPKAYIHNGYIDILKPSLLLEGTISGERIYPYIMSPEDTIDIDTMDDWNKAETAIL